MEGSVDSAYARKDRIAHRIEDRQETWHCAGHEPLGAWRFKA